MKDKTNPIVIIAFEKYHFRRSHFQKQIQKRFRTALVTIDAAARFINDERYYGNYVLLITDVPHLLNVTPNDIVVLDSNQIITDTETIDLSYSTLFLTNRVFYEILSWLLENRFPEKYHLL